MLKRKTVLLWSILEKMNNLYIVHLKRKKYILKRYTETDLSQSRIFVSDAKNKNIKIPSIKMDHLDL